MSASLSPGLASEFKFRVPENKTVPHLFPESPEMAQMPRVLATGFLVGLVEWACILALNPHIGWPDRQTVGTGMQISHQAATPPGLTVTVRVRLDKVEGKKLTFSFEAHDGVDKISEGVHERFIIDAAKFNARVTAKAEGAGSAG